jgi:hypothetical protein
MQAARGLFEIHDVRARASGDLEFVHGDQPPGG